MLLLHIGSPPSEEIAKTSTQDTKSPPKNEPPKKDSKVASMVSKAAKTAQHKSQKTRYRST